MPQTCSTVRTLSRDLALAVGESAEHAMQRVDQAEIDAVCRHLLGDITLGRTCDSPAASRATPAAHR